MISHVTGFWFYVWVWPVTDVVVWVKFPFQFLYSSSNDPVNHKQDRQTEFHVEYFRKISSVTSTVGKMISDRSHPKTPPLGENQTTGPQNHNNPHLHSDDGGEWFNCKLHSFLFVYYDVCLLTVDGAVHCSACVWLMWMLPDTVCRRSLLLLSLNLSRVSPAHCPLEVFPDTSDKNQ